MAYIFGSIWDRKNRNGLNELSSNVEKQGKSIQDLVAEGQLTPEQFEELIITVNSLIKKGQITLDDLSPKVLEAINNSDGSAFNVLSIPRDRSVTPEKTTFLKRTRNLISGDYYNLSLIGGGSARVSKTYSENGRLLFVEVEPNTQYTIQIFDTNLPDVLSRFRMAESTIHINELEFNSNGDAPLLTTQTGFPSTSPHTFTTGSSTKYIYLQPSINGVKPRVQMERGSEATEYTVPFLFLVDMIEGIDKYVRKEEVQGLNDMMWNWHTFPMSIYSETAKKTFVGGVTRGNSGGTSGHNIYSIDEETGDVFGNQLSERFSGDDHNMVALADLPHQNRVMAFYAGHSNIGIFYKFINQYDVNDLSEEHMIPESSGSTYINVHHSRSNDTMYILSRTAGDGVTVYYTDDIGETWDSKLFITGGYVDAGKSRRRDGNLGITLTGHGGSGFGDIYYCYLTLEGTVHAPDGTQIANVKTGENLPLTRNDLKSVITLPNSYTTVTSVNSYNHRLTFIESSIENNFETFNYKLAIYNSVTKNFDIYDIASDVKGSLTDKTHAHYVGSCYDVGYKYPQIYLSIKNEKTSKWEIWEYSVREEKPTNDWSKVKMAESDLKLFRPIGAMLDNSARKPIPGFWLKGYFTHYEEYYADAQIPFDTE